MIINNLKIKGAIFDLDGVLVDTAKYHYLSWKRLAAELGFDFTEKQNEALKGVSRMASLDILLETGHLELGYYEKVKLSEKKNTWYKEHLQRLNSSDLLQYVPETLLRLKQLGLRLAIGSASKNTSLILEKTGLEQYFDEIIDGNCTSRAKPDPEVFLLGAKALSLEPEQCMVFEDSAAGIQAANTADMLSIYLGSHSAGIHSDLHFLTLKEFWEYSA